MICIGIASSVASHGLQSFLPGKVLYEGDPVIPGTYDNVTGVAMSRALAQPCRRAWKRLSQPVKASKGLFKKTCWFRVDLSQPWFCMILHFFGIFKTPFLRPIATSTPTAVPSPFVAVLATWRRRAFQVQQPKTCWLTKYKLQVRNKLVDFTMPISLSYYVNPTYEIGQICLQSAVFPAFSSMKSPR